MNGARKETKNRVKGREWKEMVGNQHLLYSRGNYIQYPVINHMEKDIKKWMYICVWLSHFAVQPILAQLCKSTVLQLKKKKGRWWKSPGSQMIRALYFHCQGPSGFSLWSGNKDPVSGAAKKQKERKEVVWSGKKRPLRGRLGWALSNKKAYLQGTELQAAGKHMQRPPRWGRVTGRLPRWQKWQGDREASAGE